MVIGVGASVIERVDYTPYGHARHHNPADIDGDGDCDFDDYTALSSNYGNWGAGDFNRSGAVDFSDQSTLFANYGGAQPAGWVTKPSEGNRFGYAGYVFHPETLLYSAGYRVYDPFLGRWLTRDPAGYIDGLLLYAYVNGNPLILIDPLGLFGLFEWMGLGNDVDAPGTSANGWNYIDTAFGGFFTGFCETAARRKRQLDSGVKDMLVMGGNTLGLVSDESLDESDGFRAAVEEEYQDPGGNVLTDLQSLTVDPAIDTAKAIASGDPDAIADASFGLGMAVLARNPSRMRGPSLSHDLPSVDAPDDVPSGIVYRRTDLMNESPGRPYVGRADSDDLYVGRQQTHDRTIGTRHKYEILERAEPGPALRVAEESWMRQLDGPERYGGPLANRRWEMNDATYRQFGGTIQRPPAQD